MSPHSGTEQLASFGLRPFAAENLHTTGIALVRKKFEPLRKHLQRPAGDDHEVECVGLAQRNEADVEKLSGVGGFAGGRGGVGDQEAGVETDRRAGGGEGASEVGDAVEAWRGAEGEAGFLVQLPGGGHHDGAGKARADRSA